MWEMLAPALIGGAASFFGQRDTNQTNVDLAQSTSAFNAAEAEKNRNFQDQQAERAMRFTGEEAATNRSFESNEAAWAYKRNSHEAEVQRKWTEDMSNSAWQRGVKDMQAAGLNPMLAYSQGGASNSSGATASSPTAGGSAGAGHAGGGSQATGVNPHQVSPLAAGIHSAIEAQRAKAEIRNRELDADMKEPAAAAARKAKEGFDRIADNVPDIGGSIAKVVQMAKDELLPGLSSSAAAVVGSAIESAAVVGETAREVVKSLPSKVKAVVVNSASSARRAFDKPEHKTWSIPAAGRGKSMGSMRGKLGSAESWDYGSSRHR